MIAKKKRQKDNQQVIKYRQQITKIDTEITVESKYFRMINIYHCSSYINHTIEISKRKRSERTSNV